MSRKRIPAAAHISWSTSVRPTLLLAALAISAVPNSLYKINPYIYVKF
jgi:hypothetical protein